MLGLKETPRVRRISVSESACRSQSGTMLDSLLLLLPPLYGWRPWERCWLLLLLPPLPRWGRRWLYWVLELPVLDLLLVCWLRGLSLSVSAVLAHVWFALA